MGTDKMENQINKSNFENTENSIIITNSNNKMNLKQQDGLENESEELSFFKFNSSALRNKIKTEKVYTKFNKKDNSAGNNNDKNNNNEKVNSNNRQNENTTVIIKENIIIAPSNKKKNSCNIYDVFYNNPDFSYQTILSKPQDLKTAKEQLQNEKEKENPSKRNSIRKSLYSEKDSLSANRIEDVKKLTFKENSENSIIQNENPIKNKRLILNNKNNRNSVKRLNSKLEESNTDKNRSNLKDKFSSANKNILRRNLNIVTPNKNNINYSSAVKDKFDHSPKSNYSDNSNIKGRNYYLDLNTNLSIKSNNNLDSCKSNYSKNIRLLSNYNEKDLIKDNKKFGTNYISKYTSITPRASTKNLNDIKSKHNNYTNKFSEKSSKSPKYMNNSLIFNKHIINKNILRNDHEMKNRIRSLDEKPKQELKEKIKNVKNQIEIKMNVNKFSFNEFYDKGANNEEEYYNNTKDNFSYLNNRPSTPNGFNLNENTVYSEYSHRKLIGAANEDLYYKRHGNDNRVFTLEDDKLNLKTKIREANSSMPKANIYESNKKIKENYKNQLFHNKINYGEAITDRAHNQYNINNEKKSVAPHKTNIKSAIENIYDRENKKQEKLRQMRLQREKELQEEEQQYSFKPKINKNKNFANNNYNNNFEAKKPNKILETNFFNRMQIFDMIKNQK